MRRLLVTLRFWHSIGLMFVCACGARPVLAEVSFGMLEDDTVYVVEQKDRTQDELVSAKLGSGRTLDRWPFPVPGGQTPFDRTLQEIRKDRTPWRVGSGCVWFAIHARSGNTGTLEWYLGRRVLGEAGYARKGGVWDTTGRPTSDAAATIEDDFGTGAYVATRSIPIIRALPDVEPSYDISPVDPRTCKVYALEVDDLGRGQFLHVFEYTAWLHLKSPIENRLIDEWQGKWRSIEKIKTDISGAFHVIEAAGNLFMVTELGDLYSRVIRNGQPKLKRVDIAEQGHILALLVIPRRGDTLAFTDRSMFWIKGDVRGRRFLSDAAKRNATDKPLDIIRRCAEAVATINEKS